MKRILALLGLVLLAAVIGGAYGAIYDQLTYTISPEFFTKFRFGQFEFDPDMNERLAVAWIGFYNTWKIGAILGLVLALAGLINSDSKRMFIYTLRSFLMVILIAFVVGLIGWSIGALSGQTEPDPDLNIIDVEAFKTVVTMNNFSRAGGVIGMFVGVFYQLYSHKKYKLSQTVLV
jgi:hypothetical protein